MQLPVSFQSTRARLAIIGFMLLWLVACAPSCDEMTESDASESAATRTVDLGDRVTVSGVSSGAYMAVQTHVALADRIAGIAAVAGGPYHCAEGSVSAAIGKCMSGEGLDVSTLIAYAYEQSASGELAAVDALAKSRIFVFHSPDDTVVSPGLATALVSFYGAFVTAAQVHLVDDVKTAHGWPTLDAGAPCGATGGDFINACGYDVAGELLTHFYDDLEPRAGDVAGGRLSKIDLSRYFASDSTVADTGYVFTPAACMAKGAECRLHISFHGCRMGAEFIEDRYAKNAGLNEWAATNRIVVLYPQIEKSATNPQGCWDWWGYTGAGYDRRRGKQVAGIDAILSAFAAGKL